MRQARLPLAVSVDICCVVAEEYVSRFVDGGPVSRVYREMFGEGSGTLSDRIEEMRSRGKVAGYLGVDIRLVESELVEGQGERGGKYRVMSCHIMPYHAMSCHVLWVGCTRGCCKDSRAAAAATVLAG